MCGLVGIVNRELNRSSSDSLIRVFSQGLYCDALRGKHGTGIMGVDNKGDVAIYKKALASADFLELKKPIEIIDDSSNVFLMGHNRYATQGGHTSDNAHPFSHGGIHLFHNGTLDTFRTLNPRKTFTVDSDALAHFIAMAENVPKALEEIEGAYSLVWYDESTESLNFARNKERPMYFGLIKDSLSFIYASESDMIVWLAGRNGIVIDKIISTSVGKLISVPLDPKEKTLLLPFTPKEPKPVYYGKSYYSSQGKSNVNYSTTERSGGLVATKPGKYDHLKGKEVVIEAENWIPYISNTTSATIFGQLKCKYDANLTIHVSSIAKSVVHLYKGQLIVVKITAVLSDGVAYSKLIRIAKAEDMEDYVDEIDVIDDEDDINEVIDATDAENVELEINFTAEELEEKMGNILVVMGPKSKFIPLAEYSEKTKNGCMHCCKTITVNDAPNLLWDSNGVDVLCPECKRLYVM